MSKRIWIVGIAALAAASGLAVASGTATRAHGKFTDVDSTRREGGIWRIGVLTRTRNGNTREIDVVQAAARNLDVSGATASNPPSFHVYLVTSDSSTSADFGKMRVNRHGKGGFMFDTRFGSTLPSGVTSLSTFSGGTIEIHDGSGTVVLSATLP